MRLCLHLGSDVLCCVWLFFFSNRLTAPTESVLQFYRLESRFYCLALCTIIFLSACCISFLSAFSLCCPRIQSYKQFQQSHVTAFFLFDQVMCGPCRMICLQIYPVVTYQLVFSHSKVQRYEAIEFHHFCCSMHMPML